MSRHHNHIQLALFDVMLAERFPDDSFYTISVCCAGERFFGHNHSKPGVSFAVAHKKNFEVLIRYVFSANNLVKTVFAQ